MDFALRCYRAVSYARAVLAMVAAGGGSVMLAAWVGGVGGLFGATTNWTLFVIGWTLLLASRVFALRESPR